MRKQFIRNHGLRIFYQCQIWPLTPASRSRGVIILKSCYISLIIGSWASKCENNFWKSWPANLLQVSDLTFDPCFKVECDHQTKTAIYLLYIGLWAWNSHHEWIKYVSFSHLHLHESSYIWQHLLGCVYFLQLKLFLIFSQLSMLPI